MLAVLKPKAARTTAIRRFIAWQTNHDVGRMPEPPGERAVQTLEARNKMNLRS
jgi:hypothetical protein